MLGLRYADAAPTALIGASNHFEVAIATAVDALRALFGRGAGDGGRRPDRGAVDAGARAVLPADAGLVPGAALRRHLRVAIEERRTPGGSGIFAGS